MHLLMIPNNIIDKIYLTTAFKEKNNSAIIPFNPHNDLEKKFPTMVEKKKKKKTKYLKVLILEIIVACQFF